MTNKGKITLPKYSREGSKQFLQRHQRLCGVVYACFVAVLISFRSVSRQSGQSKVSAYHPYFLESVVVLQRDYVLRERNELEIVRRDVDLSQHAFLLQDPVDQCRNARYKDEGIRVFLGLFRVSLDVVYPRRPSDMYDRRGGTGRLASDDLDVTDKRTTKIHHVSCCRSQGSGFEPEHFVHSVVLSIDIRSRRSHRERGLTFNRDTSVTRPNGPAIELSSTSVFAPLTLKENSRSQLPSRADARSSRNTPSSGSRSGPFSQSP